MHNYKQSPIKELIIDAARESELLKGTDLEFPKSRLHKLRTADAYLKRDDELSFTMSGAKFRKLCGMHRYLQSRDSFSACGSSRSAFLFALAQLCLQMGKSLELSLLKSTPWADKGTDTLYRKVFEAFPITWVDRKHWSEVKTDIREGGVGEDALLGVMSLGLDIAQQIVGLDIENIWIDAGTGLSARALIYSLGELLESPPLIHVVLCAGNEDEFTAELSKFPFKQAPFRLYRPPTARSYGSTNRKVWDLIDRYLRTEGVLLDPIYSAKLLMAYEEKGMPRSLIVHSGGGLNNFGF